MSKLLKEVTRVENHLYVVKIYGIVATGEYYYTIAKDAIWEYTSEKFQPKDDCVRNVNLNYGRRNL